jgi:hypothetical protein
MSTLYRRSARVIVGTNEGNERAVEADGLHMEFKVTKTLKATPNTLDLSIANLSEATRSKLQKRGAPVILMAGYVGSLAQIFSGDTRTIDHVRKGSDWLTRVQGGDGEKQYTFSRVSESFAAGTRVLDAAERVANAMMGRDCGQIFRNLKAQMATAKPPIKLKLERFAHGFAAQGRAAAEFDRLMHAAGLTWSIQDGQLQMLPPGLTQAARAVVLSADSGLIGSPEHASPDSKGKPSALKARSLLQPELRCGGVVEFQSTAVKGQYRIEKVTHTGDTASGGWFSDIECQPVSGAISIAEDADEEEAA